MLFPVPCLSCSCLSCSFPSCACLSSASCPCSFRLCSFAFACFAPPVLLLLLLPLLCLPRSFASCACLSCASLALAPFPSASLLSCFLPSLVLVLLLLPLLLLPFLLLLRPPVPLFCLSCSCLSCSFPPALAAPLPPLLLLPSPLLLCSCLSCSPPGLAFCLPRSWFLCSCRSCFCFSCALFLLRCFSFALASLAFASLAVSPPALPQTQFHEVLSSSGSKPIHVMLHSKRESQLHFVWACSALVFSLLLTCTFCFVLLCHCVNAHSIPSIPFSSSSQLIRKFHHSTTHAVTFGVMRSPCISACQAFCSAYIHRFLISHPAFLLFQQVTYHSMSVSTVSGLMSADSYTYPYTHFGPSRADDTRPWIPSCLAGSASDIRSGWSHSALGVVFSSQHFCYLHSSGGAGADVPPCSALVVICFSGLWEESYMSPSLRSSAPPFGLRPFSWCWLEFSPPCLSPPLRSSQVPSL